MMAPVHNVRARSLVGLVLVCFSSASWSLPNPEMSSEVLFEGAHRISGEWDTQRLLGQTSLEVNESPWEAKLTLWGWKNFQFKNYAMEEYDLAVRTARISYWSDSWGVSAGLGELHWGETFGLQPTDLINARNYRDFPILDHGRNRVPALLMNAFKQFDSWKLETFFNPMGTLPILPNQLQGLALLQPERSTYFWTQPEFGMRVGQELSQGRWNLFALHHASRFPALVLVPRTGGLNWDARFAPVSSVGSSVSFSFGDFVYRIDAVATPSHPCSDGLRSSPCDVYSVVAGADWAAAQIPSLTVGAQWHVDRYPLLDARARHGASVFVRKGLFSDQLTAELMGFAGVSLRDRWLRAKADWTVSRECTVGALAEWIEADPRSALRLFKDLSRVLAQMRVFF